ncbi:chymotrypsin-2-like [Schistocerca americana]|uniref:chymotrypsin-2-like n=1 Tax=Schistocerca americana TaxID=7009 RepID=UPI001F502D5C|nr:chymotrypsin-2-like [Schistocerca americana]XP_049947449.1 chymotrypsin-2-like [Schistocerca serialis cubense]
MMRLCVIAALLVAAAAVPQKTMIHSLKNPGHRGGGRVIGGSHAERGQFPFSAFINSNGYVCGGALISQRYVLTIAQCIDGLTHWEVYLGAADLSAVEPGRTVVTTVRGLKYPGYDTALTGLTSDIGLIDLGANVPLSPYVQPAKLPARSEIGKVYLGQEGVFVGFGTTTVASANAISDYSLNYATLEVIDDGDEGWAMRAKGHNGESGCDDYGSPLVQYRNETAVVIGVNTFIAGGDGCNNAVTGFTVVSLYLDWISYVAGVQIDHVPA